MGPTVDDDGEPYEQLPSLLPSSSSPNTAVQDQVHTNTFNATKSSGDEPPYNRWLELIDQRRGKNKAPLQLSEISRARLNTVFPIVYCTDPHNQFNNDSYWEPCILKKAGRELFEVLDANKDLKLLKEELEYTGEEGLRYLWGLVYKHPSMAFVSTFRKKLVTSVEGNETKRVTQVVPTACPMQDENGIRFANLVNPSASSARTGVLMKIYSGLN